MKIEKVTMNTGLGFLGGVDDATIDRTEGWLPAEVSIDFIVNQLRVMVGASDSYIAGYLSVVFGE